MPLTSVSNDTFYLEEIEAPKGYELVVKELIKVHIKPEWDGENEKYVINPEIVIGEDNIEEDDEDSTEDGETATRPSNSINVKWKNNNVIITDSYNYGAIQGKSDVGGIIGGVKGDVIIAGCHNMLNENKDNVVVATDGNAGGIIGCSLMNTKEDMAELEECTNETDIRGLQGSYANVGGIIGNAITQIEVTNCENSGLITATTTTGSSYSSKAYNSAGGIIGATYYKAIVDGCTSTGEIHSSGNAGGILGATSFMGNKDILGFYTENIYLEINNCTVKDVYVVYNDSKNPGITANEHSAGIVGCTEALQSVITNCKVESTILAGGSKSEGWNLGNGNTAGICGMFYGDEFIAYNNVVDKCEIYGQCHSAGILASKGVYHSYEGNLSSLIKDMRIDINDCHVYGGKIFSSSKKAAGILGDSDIYGTESMEVNINNCSVQKDDNDKGTEINANSEMASGIYGGAYLDDITAIIDLNNNIVDGATIKRGSNGGSNNGPDVSGICAGFWSTNGAITNINISNCQVLNSELSNNNNNGYTPNTAGILSNTYLQGQAEVKIDGCKVKNVNINAAEGATAGIFAQTWGYNGEVYMNDNEVEDLTIKYLNETLNGASSSGGIMGSNYAFGLSMDNNIVKHITIINGPGNMGGLVGYSSYAGIQITNSKCIGKKVGENVECSRLVPLKSNNVVGGIIGGFNGCDPYSHFEDVIIKNVECSDMEILDPNGGRITNWGLGDAFHSFGSIIGNSYTDRSIDINNVIVSNINANLYSSGQTLTSGRYLLGGFAGGIVGSGHVNIDNVAVSNISIDSNRGGVSGFIEDLTVGANISNVNVDNCKLNVIDEYYGIGKSNDVSGFIGVMADTNNNSCKIHDININDVEIEITGNTSNDKYVSEGCATGLIGCNITEDVDIKDIIINNISIISNYNEKRTVSGAVGIVYGNMNIDNIALDNATLTVNIPHGKSNTNRKAHIGGIVAVNCSEKGLSIKDSKVNNIEMNNSCIDAITGGMVAVSIANEERSISYNEKVLVNGKLSISDSEVNNITANGNYAVGGILGSGIAKINNVIVKNPKITAITEYEEVEPNGTAGGAVAIAVEGSELSNITVTSDKDDEEYGVSSDYLAGGICAINSGDSLTGSKVENIVVRTTQEIIEEEFPNVGGEGEEEELIQNKDLSQSCADAVQARSWNAYINTIISNVKVIVGADEKIIGE